MKKLIGVLFAVGVLSLMFAASAEATNVCNYTYDGCQTTTTAEVTTTTAYVTTTTEPEEETTTTTTTAPTTTGFPFCNPNNTQGVQCLNIDPTTTTAPATTTTTVAATTTAPEVTTGEGTQAQEPETIPPLVVEAPTTTTPDELPVTGGSPWWLALFGGCLIVLGGLAIAWKRTP